jgi:hypothetical protein
MMRSLFVALLMMGCLGRLEAAETEGVSTQYPFCIRDVDKPASNFCTFTTFRECLASTSGAGKRCFANPRYSPVKGVTPDPDSRNIELDDIELNERARPP